MKKLVIFFFILLQPTFSSNIPTLYFTPNRQTDKIVISLIEGAESSLYIAGYSVSWENILKLIKKKQESVDVKVLVDGQIKGVPEDIVRVYKKPGLFHPKFITVDEKTVLIGSGNFTEDGFHLHHNHFLLIQDRDIADFFNRRFLAWWDDMSEESQKVKLKGQKTKGENQKLEIYQDGIYRIYFSPETDCESVIIQEISKARDTIHFAHYRFTSETITKAIILRKMAGVNVYGIMDASGIAPYSVFYPLSDYGCQLKKSNIAGLLHDKLFIIDRETVITGSYNPTASARHNTECLLIIKDKETAQKLLKEWKKLWFFYSLP